MAAIEYRGLNAVTNFDLSRYIKWLRPNNQNNPNNFQLQPNPNGDVIIDSASPKPHLGSIRSTSSDDGSSGVAPTCGGASSASASSALGLLLQSSKFKEMLERTCVADSSSSPSTASPELEPPRSRSFPEDIQTYFDCQDSGSYTEGDDILFGDLGSTFDSPISFHCEGVLD